MAWLYTGFQEDVFDLSYCTSEEQAADIFTKHFVNVDKFDATRKLIGHLPKHQLFKTPSTISMRTRMAGGLAPLKL